MTVTDRRNFLLLLHFLFTRFCDFQCTDCIAMHPCTYFILVSSYLVRCKWEVPLRIDSCQQTPYTEYTGGRVVYPVSYIE